MREATGKLKQISHAQGPMIEEIRRSASQKPERVRMKGNPRSPRGRSQFLRSAKADLGELKVRIGDVVRALDEPHTCLREKRGHLLQV